MKISCEWLKDYINVKIAPAELAKLFTMSGLSVDSIDRIDGDHVLEIEVTSNRPDWLSVIGVARELAALTGKKLKAPRVKGQGTGGKGKKEEIAIKIEEKKLCPMYTGRVIRDVTVGGSPEWLKKRLRAVGVRPVNNIVDITNFCLFETGEPMHAFDLDKIEGGRIIVRKAKSGETLRTIDGVERTLDPSMLVIADAVKPVALAGVMGGVDTEVTAATKNVLLEAASFEPITIRRAGRKLALASESSYRFERKAPLETIPYASDRATALIAELAGGRAEKRQTVGVKPSARRVITLRPSRVASVLGVPIPTARMKKILAALGMKVAASAKDAWKIAVPEFRADLQSEIDCIEEIARIYGYDKIPATLPLVVDQPTRMEKSRLVERRVAETLTALGASEIISYSLLSRSALLRAGQPEEAIVGIRNPLSGEQEVMRSSLLPGMLGAMLWNINRKTKDLKLFELGGVYRAKAGAAPYEAKHLSIGVAGETTIGWAAHPRACDFYDLKGMVEALLAALGIDEHRFRQAEAPGLSSAACAELVVGGEVCGVLGEVAPSVREACDVKEKAFFAELALAPLVSAAELERAFCPVPRFPAVLRDISIVVAKDAVHADLVAAMADAGGELLKNVELIDRYIGKQVPAGRVSLTYRIAYQDPGRTLEERDIQAVHTRVLSALESRFGAQLRQA